MCFVLNWPNVFFCSSCSDLLALGVAVEVVRPHLFAEHHVIVEVNELLRQTWDTVDVCLYGRGTEGGELTGVEEYVLQS